MINGDYSIGVLAATDELFWRLPDGYARCGSSLRCLECASLIRNVRDDVKLHSNFHAELKRSGKWLERALRLLGLRP